MIYMKPYKIFVNPQQNSDYSLKLTKRKYKNISTVSVKLNFVKNKNFVKILDISMNDSPLYSFVSGMFYSYGSEFDLNKKPPVRYPYSSYYKFRIPSIEKEGKVYKSLIYSKLPLIILQFKNYYVAVEFNPITKTSYGKELVPLISFECKNGKTEISFAICNDFKMKVKKNIWLGKGSKIRYQMPFEKNETLKLNFKITKKKGFWFEHIEYYFRKNKINNTKISEAEVKETIKNLKTALWRAWDDKFGTFAQLPWKEIPGFALDKYSWGLLSYEAVNMVYFYDYWLVSKDEDYFYWVEKLRELFLNTNISHKPKHGRGKIWYEMTDNDGKKLTGFYYNYTGYAGYPGGQATIALYLLQYFLKRKQNEGYADEKILRSAKQSLEYIISTQNKDGSWPSAIEQCKETKLRKKDFILYKTTGGTAECVKALLLGYKILKKKKYLIAAKKGLEFLVPKKESGFSCRGVNILRDIGKDEVEGVSAIYAINAFLDGYNVFKKKKYLDYAIIWSDYMLTWFYWWNSDALKLKGYFHPISESITPRISPYESLLTVNACLRLYRTTKNIFWKKMAMLIYKKVLTLREKDGGMCECYCPGYLEGLYTIPMEQTFATAELLKASMNISKMQKFKLFNKKKEKFTEKGEKIGYKIGKNLSIFNRDKELLRFDFKNFKMPQMGDMLNNIGIDLSFYDPFSEYNLTKSKIKNKFKTRWRKVILSFSDYKSLFKGMEAPQKIKVIKFKPFSKQKKTFYDIQVLNKYPLTFKIVSETKLYRVESILKIILKNKKLYLFYDPLTIKTLKNNLYCRQVLFVLGLSSAKIQKNKREIVIKSKKRKIRIKGNSFDTFLQDENKIAFDLSLKTNWTHHGIYKDKILLTAEVLE